MSYYIQTKLSPMEIWTESLDSKSSATDASWPANLIF